MDQTRIGISSLEAALADTEREAGNAVASVARLQSLAKKVQHAAQGGNLRELRKGLDGLGGVLKQASDALDILRESWDYSEEDEEAYLASRAYVEELVSSAEALGVTLQPQEGAIACYPSLLKVLPKERALKIDSKPHRQLRPSHLAAELVRRQKRPLKLNLNRFVETLLSVYEQCTRRGEIAPLIELYRRMTVLPWVAKEYSQQEFARDIYLLDASPDLTAKDGSRFRLHPGATAAKNRANLMVVITRDGAERTYYGIEFSAGSRP